MRTLGHVYLPGMPGTSVGRFSFLVADDEVEVGDMVTAETPEGEVVGSVIDLRVVGTDNDPVRLAPARSAGDSIGFLPDVVLADVAVIASPHLRPVRAGVVRASSRDEVAWATGQSQMKWPIPVGCVSLLGNEPGHREYVPVHLDGDFLLGPEAQGVIAAGRSGVASKTSFLSVLMRSAMAHATPAHRVGALVFNVKGSDLVEIDAVGEPLDDTDRLLYDAMGTPPTPFPGAVVYAPSQLGATNTSRADAIPLRWGLRDVWANLWMLFDDYNSDDKLSGFLAAYGAQLFSGQNRHRKEPFPDTFAGLASWMQNELDAVDDDAKRDCWGPTHPATMRKLLRKFNNLYNSGNGLFADGTARPEHDVPAAGWNNGDIVVVDISRLEPKLQAFVIARTLHRVMSAAERGELGIDHLIVMADELNMWAPAAASEFDGVRKWLRKLATQGRYAGLSLFGACQAASRVDALIVENCATRVVGSSAETELTSGTYGRLGAGMVEKLATMPKGQMAVWHSAFRQHVVVRFPRPAWKMGKPSTSAGSRPRTGVDVLRRHLGDTAFNRLVEGIDPDTVASIAATGTTVDDTAAELRRLREPDSSKTLLHAARAANPDDPYALEL